MQLITMNYLISFPESLQMYKWYVLHVLLLPLWFECRVDFLTQQSNMPGLSSTNN